MTLSNLNYCGRRDFTRLLFGACSEPSNLGKVRVGGRNQLPAEVHPVGAARGLTAHNARSKVAQVKTTRDRQNTNRYHADVP